MSANTAQAVDVVTASQAAKIIGCSRGYIDILMLKGQLTPAPSKKPFYCFEISEVEEAKKTLRKNQKQDEKA